MTIALKITNNKILRPASDLHTMMKRRLQPTAFFNGFDDAQFASLQPGLVLKQLNSGDFLFLEGEAPSYFYFVNSGQIKLTRVSQKGDEKVFEVVQEGETFAEALMFSGAQGYPVNSQAVTDSQIICINASQYMDLLHKSPVSCFKVMAILSVKLHDRLNEIDRLTLHSAAYRLAYWLVDQQSKAKESTNVNLNTPKNTIASHLSIKPETLSRLLKRLSKLGFISVHKANIEIIDLPGLKQSIIKEQL